MRNRDTKSQTCRQIPKTDIQIHSQRQTKGQEKKKEQKERQTDREGK